MNKPVHILVDMRAASKLNRSGVGNYAAKLIEALAKNYPELKITGHYFNFLGRQTIGQLPQTDNIQYKVSRILPEKVFNLLRRNGIPIPFELLIKRRGTVNVFPDYLMSPSIFRTPTVCIIHDLSFADMPEVVSPRNRADLTKLVPYGIARATKIVAVSDFTKNRVAEHYSVDTSKISTVSPAVDRNHYYPRPDTEITKTRKKYKLPRYYILYAGNFEPRKNIEGIINAYALLDPKLRKKFALVLAGGKGWLSEQIYQVIASHQKMGHNIIVTGFIDAKYMPALMSGAALFVFPSFYEGFGMPPLEAMACGVPVISANNSSLPEAIGDAGILIDANDTRALSINMKRLIGNQVLRKKYINKGYKQVARFTWDEAAAQLKDAIDKT